MGSGDPLNLDQESLNLLLEDQTAEEYGYEMMAKSLGGQAINRTMSLGMGIKYDSLPDGRRIYDYHFWGGAYNTAFWFDRETGISGVFMTQLYPTRYTVTDKIDSVIDKYIGN
jgi:CubicO group peptidase (beta-lactamase class C family)